jgi:hypothetical protein
VGALEHDYRRGGLILAATLCLALAIVTIIAISRPRTAFEWEQARAEAANPSWVVAEIDTADHRRKYRLGEAVRITVHFHSVSSFKYKIETAEGASFTALTDELHISDGRRIPLKALAGVACCGSHLIGLDDEGYSPPAGAPLQFGPGSYEIYLSTRRIFSWGEVGWGEYSESSFEVASNLLKLRVVR